ncbi:MAG: helix-turn-helix transcriptional regulator [Leptothrix sp. (in: b-proteobacteria)]
MHLLKPPSAPAAASVSPAMSGRLLRLDAVEARVGIRKSSIYALQRRGEFPQSVQLTARCVAWRESDIDAWINARAQSRNAVGVST